MLKAVVFDFDGVIVDSEPLHHRAFIRVAQQFGVSFDYETYILAVERLSIPHAKLGLEPAQCLAIEDTTAGIASASDAGLVTLAVTSTQTASHLHPADRVVETLEGLTSEQLHLWFGS